MPDLGFYVGLAIGVVLGFGAGLAIFLPIVWRQVDLEDSLDKRKSELGRAVETIEKIRLKLDALVAGRELEYFKSFSEPENGLNIPLTPADKGTKWRVK